MNRDAFIASIRGVKRFMNLPDGHAGPTRQRYEDLEELRDAFFSLTIDSKTGS